MIADLRRTSHTAGLLAYLYGPGEHGDQSNPRVVGGDCHGAPIDPFAQATDLISLARALDAPVERLGTRAPERPVWVCTVRSDPRHPDLTDAQWGDVAACRWVALRNQHCQMHIVATLAREDGSPHIAYRDAFHLQTECHHIATELGHLPPQPKPPAQERPLPITVTIAPEPSGSVVARGGDNLAKSLLDHAGFAYANDWHGPRHRLPTSMPHEQQAAIATHAAQMLRTARYTVDLDPALDISPSGPSDRPALDDQLLDLTERIRGARTGAELSQSAEQLVHPDHGVLERVREALEAVGEQATDLDHEAYRLADRFAIASEFVIAAESELVGAIQELTQIGPPEPVPDQNATHRAALATSPSEARTAPARNTSPSAPAAVPPAGPARNSAPRVR